MYLKPKRFRGLPAFCGGLAFSVLFAGAGAWWWMRQSAAWQAQWREEIRQEVEETWADENPHEVVYLFASEMKSGQVIEEHHLKHGEVSERVLPEDALLDVSLLLGKVVRQSVSANTLCTQSLVYQPGTYPDDARIQEYTAIQLPQRLEKNQSVDIRIMFPNGLDYVVLPKKQVLDLERDGSGSATRIWLTVEEEELLRMSSAVVDAYLHPGTVLYAVTYVAPDVQEAATVTYPPNEYVQDLILANPNILFTALSTLERTSRQWFDTIPDPQPHQPMIQIPSNMPVPERRTDAQPDPNVSLESGAMQDAPGAVEDAGPDGSASQELGPETEMGVPPDQQEEGLFNEGL